MLPRRLFLRPGKASVRASVKAQSVVRGIRNKREEQRATLHKQRRPTIPTDQIFSDAHNEARRTTTHGKCCIPQGKEKGKKKFMLL
jgi:hypothetical protein